MTRLWHVITTNSDGTPVLGAVWAGPLLIGAAVAVFVRAVWFD